MKKKKSNSIPYSNLIAVDIFFRHVLIISYIKMHNIVIMHLIIINDNHHCISLFSFLKIHFFSIFQIQCHDSNDNCEIYSYLCELDNRTYT